MGRKREYHKFTLITKEQIIKYRDKLEIAEDEELEKLGKKLLESYNKIYAKFGMVVQEKNRLSLCENNYLDLKDKYNILKSKYDNIDNKINRTIKNNKELITENAKLKIKLQELQNNN